jgi:L-Ala-D/L-Glu epimerase / N-acetyl-D-glutamate racemase
MRVARLDAVPIGLPFDRPYATATGRLERREMLIVRIEAADGTVGWGDAVPMSLRGGPGLEAVRRDIERVCAPALTGIDLGDPTAAHGTAVRLCDEAGAGDQALSAIDIAMLDLAGKTTGEPAWRVLGATAGTSVTCNATIGADPPDAAARDAATAVQLGFGTVKVKVGDDDDLERIRAIRAAVGPGTRLRIDANGVWPPQRAVERVAGIAALGLELAEQPCADIPGLARVRSETGVPVVADESVGRIEEARAALAAGACDAVNLKLAKVGGPLAAIAIADAAPAYLSSALDSALGIAAAAHTAAAMPSRGFAAGLAHGLATSPLFTDNVAVDAPLAGPGIDPGERPGLGIDVDEAAIDRLRLR